MRKFIFFISFFVSIYSSDISAQVHYVFHNTSSVNQKSYTDDEIFINIVIPVPGFVGYFDGVTDAFQNIATAPNYTWPDGTVGKNLNVKLSDLPKDANGNYYINLPANTGGRIYVAFGEPLYRNDLGNPLLDAPANPNYMTKVETIEFYTGGMLFTNTSRVDRYSYPMGEEIYCGHGAVYDKVGETVSHEMVIKKWQRFVHDAFQYSYDPTRDIIYAPKFTDYFKPTNPGGGYFDAFSDAFFAYYSTHTLQARWNNTLHTATVNGANQLVWNTGEVFTRADFDNILQDNAAVWYPSPLGMAFMASILRGAVQNTTAVQVWDDPANFWVNDVRSDYMAFFHSDLVSFDSKTYAYDLDDVFDQSSTQACNNPDSVVVSLGGFGVEHVQILDKVYITPLDGDAEVAQYATIQLDANGIDEHDLDMDIPNDAVITWTVTDPGGNPANNLISSTGQFGPTNVIGDYTVTLTVVSDGNTFTDTRVVSVKDPLTVPQICTGSIGTTAEYRLEIIGTKVYLTLVPLAGHSGNPEDFFFGTDDQLNHWGQNTLMPNIPYPMTGFFFGDEMWFWISDNGGALVLTHIPNLGTCDGLQILEEVIALYADNHTMAETDAPYTIDVNAVSNIRNITQFDLPDAICTGNLTFSGTGVNTTTGVFTPAGPGVFPITITYAGVNGNVTTTINITVTDAGCVTPISVNLGADQVICQGETATFNTGGGFATYTWTGVGVDNGATFNATVAGTYTVLVSDGGSCTATDEITLTVNANPTPAIGDEAICIGETATFDATNAYSIYTWDGVVGIQTYTTSVDGMHTLEVEDTNGCTGTTNFTLTVNDKPTLTVTNPAAVCSPSTVSIVQTAQAGYTFTYYESDQITTVTNPATINASGTFYITKINNTTSCVSDFEAVTVTVNAKPTLTVNNPAAVCAPSTVSIVQTAEAGYTFNYYESDQTTTVTDPNTIAASGTFYITKTDDATSCVSDFEAVTVTVNPKPTLTVTNPAAVCAPSTVSIVQTAEAGYTFAYYESDQTTTVTDPATIAVSGTFYITKTDDATSCVSDFEAVTVTVNAKPTLTITNPVAVCSPSTVSIVQTAEAGYTFNYYESDQTTTLANSTAIATSGTFYITKTDDATSCVSDFEEVTVTVNAKPTLTVNNPAAVCAPNTVSIVQTAEAGYTFAYYESDQTTTVTDPAAIGASGTFYITKTDNATSCVSDFEEVTVTVNAKPTLTITNPVAVCSPSTVSIVQTAEAGYTFTYYESDQTTTVTDPATINSSGTFYITKTNNTTSCVSDFELATVTINSQPTLSVTSPAAVCSPAVASIVQVAEAGYTFNYYENDQTTLVADPTNMATSGNYYITKTDDATSCVSDFEEITVTVNAKPTLTITNPVAVCSPSTVSIIQIAEAGYTFAYYESDQTTTVTDPATIGASGTFYITKTDDATSCVSDFEEVTVTVNAKPTLTVTNPVAVCSPSTVSIVQNPQAGYTFTYYESDQTTTVTNPATINASGTFYITKTNNTTSCVSDFELATVTINSQPTLSVTSPAAVCSPAVASIVQVAEAGYTFNYYENDQTTLVADPTNMATSGSYYITKTDDATTCVSDFEAVTVTVTAKPTLTVNNPAAVCDPMTVDLSTTVSSSLAGTMITYWTDASATASYATPTTATDGTYYIKGETAVGCSNIQPVIVIVTAIPTISVNDLTLCEGSSATLSALGADSYLWSPATGLSDPNIANPTVSIGETTNYSLLTKTGGCIVTKVVKVKVIEGPRIEKVTETGTDQITVVVRGGEKPYQYSLDGGNYTYNGVFGNMERSTEYMIAVTDNNQCEASTVYEFEGHTLTIPPFFTPNDDGFNDTWEIRGLENYPNAEIFIYDRFGKLLIQYKGTEKGWDGKNLGKIMSSTDYWYIINLDRFTEKKIGHFTLKH